MAAVPRYRLKQTPTDTWSIRERLCLASSVLRSGDQNWVSVSRAIKSFGEPNRPPDWFSQKNCALQYSDQLEKIEAPKKKRWDRADKETPGDLIVRKLTIERIDELKKLIQEKQQRHRKLKRDIEMIKSGQMDDKLDEIWSQIQDEMKAKEQAEKDHQKWLQDREARIAALKAMPRVAPLLSKKKIPIKVPRVGELRRNSSQSEQSEQDSAVESPISEPLSVEVEDAVSPLPSSVTQEGPPATPTKFTGMAPPAVTTPTSQHPTPSTSPLLTSLLKSPTPATPASPISSVLVSPTQQPKEGTIATPQASPRPTSAPQTFFNPTSALATAAARQLAVATASVSPSVASLFSSDKSDSSGKAESSVNLTPPIHSVTSSAPTLSKLLEMPPSIPGKLPPLPIVRPPETVATINVTTSATTTTQAEPYVPMDSKEVLPISPGITTSTDVKKEKKIKEEPMSPPPQISEVAKTAEIIEENTAGQTEDNSKPDTNINNEFKEEVETEEIQQVIVMEVDFAGEEIKGDKGEIIEEVFEVTAPEGSIVEVEYETISDDGACKEEFIALPVKEKPATPPEEPTEEVSVKEIIPITSEVIVEDRNESQKIIEEKEEVRPEKVEDEKAEENVKEVKSMKEEPSEQIPPEEPAAEKAPRDKVEEISGKKEVIEEKEETVDSSSVKSEEIIVRSIKRPGRKGKRSRGRGGKILLPDFEVESTPSPLPEEDKEEKQVEKAEETHTEESIREETPELKLVESAATPDTLGEAVEETTASDNRDEKLEVKKAEETNNYEAIVESPATKDEGSFQQMQTGEESTSEDKYKPPSSISDSIPNSPASTSQSDDQESLREYKVWKKAIMLVWRAAANHKFANVFLHPVTNDVAPGYHSIVYRPMDLSVIKKNIENGVIKTTIEFQRDMMLMFQNAIMYNSSDHDVFHMALEMQKEVMEQIQDFLATQLMVQTADTKVLRGRERETRDRKSESTDKEEETKRKRTSTSTSDSESKQKKRKIL